jgi:arylsulfatase A-like enzyme
MSTRVAEVLGALALFAGSALFSACSHDQPKRPRNVLIIAIDTLRPDHLGCYGYSRATSPALDDFARSGLVFENAQASAPWTAPSLISLMTGLEPEVHQVIDSPNPGRMSDNVTTLAEVLKAHGFTTAAFTEGGYAKGQFGLDQGFDEYPANAGDNTSDHAVEPRESRLDGNLARTLAWLSGHHDKPFLLFFHTYEVHTPYRASESCVRAFRPGFDEGAERDQLARIITTWNEKQTLTRDDCAFLWPRALLLRTHAMWKGLPELEHTDDLVRAAGENGFGPKHLLEQPEMLALVRDLYDAGIASADRGIAKLLAGLQELGLDQDTLVVIVSDHGEGLGQHGQLEHGYVLHEEILHVVMMMRIPGGDVAPRHIADPVRLVDVPPTVLDLLGIDARTDVFQGRSLVPALRGALPPMSSLAHGRTIERKSDALYSLRSGTWRLELDLGTQDVALYDDSDDPGEMHDVASAHPDVVERLRAEILRQHSANLALRKAIRSDVTEQTLDPKTMKELNGMGYGGSVPKEH